MGCPRPPDRALDMQLFLLATTPLLALAIGSLILLGLPDLDPPPRHARRD